MEPDDTALSQSATEAGAMPTSVTPPLKMTDETQADVFSNHRQLVQWVLENEGYLHPGAQLAFSSRKGYHAVVTDGTTLSNGTRVASCPMPLTISVLNALDIHPFSSHGTRFPAPFLRNQSKSPQSLQAFFLMEQLVLGEKSWWAPYIATLPTVDDIGSMQFSEEDVVWLEGTNLKGGLSDQSAQWKEMFSQGMEQLEQLGWASTLNGSYTWPRFRWAATIFGSRSFTSQVLDATLPADLARFERWQTKDQQYDIVKLFSDRFGVLLPLLDLLNHKPGAKVEWQAQYNFVGLRILETYNSGEELCNNYGPRDNEGLLLAYGFTIENNPFDHFNVKIRAPPGSPLDVARNTWTQSLRSDPERRCFIFDYKHPESTNAKALEMSLFSFDLLDSISILCANEREMQGMNSRRQSLMCTSLGGKIPGFEDGRNVLATLSQLLRDCSARAERLKMTDPSRSAAGQTPSNSKQRNAKIYRDGQLEIVETAVAVCKFVLRDAIDGTSDVEQLLVSVQGLMSESTFANLEILARRHTRITHPRELLSYEDLLNMMPQPAHLRECLSGLEQHFLTHAHGTLEAPAIADFNQCRLAVSLSALYSEYSRGVKLPQRVTEWIKQLVAWYPPDSDTWAFVPSPGPWTPGEEPPPDLVSLLAARAAMCPTMPVDSTTKRWLRSERICWGWNVMEEEKVIVPTCILDRHNGVAIPGNSVLLYSQHY